MGIYSIGTTCARVMSPDPLNAYWFVVVSPPLSRPGGPGCTAGPWQRGPRDVELLTSLRDHPRDKDALPPATSPYLLGGRTTTSSRLKHPDARAPAPRRNQDFGESFLPLTTDYSLSSGHRIGIVRERELCTGTTAKPASGSFSRLRYGARALGVFREQFAVDGRARPRERQASGAC